MLNSRLSLIILLVIGAHTSCTVAPTSTAPVTVSTLPPAPTSKIQSIPTDDCTIGNANSWSMQLEPIFIGFYSDSELFLDNIVDFDSPFDTELMEEIYKRNIAREDALSRITPPSCLDEAHKKLQNSFSSYSAMYKSASENDNESTFSNFEEARDQFEEAFSLIEAVFREHLWPFD